MLLRVFRDFAFFALGFLLVSLVALLPEVAFAAPLSDTDIQQQTTELLASSSETQILFIKFAHVVCFALGVMTGNMR
ncbi:MAG: hypothetical protein K6L74_07510 [Neptuniibacter sp.]